MIEVLIEKTVLILSFMILFFIRIGYKKILRFIAAEKKYLILVFLISLPFLSTVKNFATTDDWEQCVCAKSFLTNDNSLFKRCPHYGYTYPVLLFFFTKVFGISEDSLIVFHFIFSS